MMSGFHERIRATVRSEVAEALRNLERIEPRLETSVGYGAAIWHHLSDFIQRSMVLQGRTASWQLPRQRHIRDLTEVEMCVFSQWGEDGIIEWLVAHLPNINTRFVEFGVESFAEANCRFLLMNRNWKGLVFDGSDANIQALRSESLYWKYDITATTAFITRENINNLISQNGVAGEIGILSVDIDGNDYWVLEAIDVVRPAIIICEYNPILGDTRPVTVPYRADFTRFSGHHSGLYFGASILAIRYLMAARGFTFVGTNSNGINAFFIRNDLAPHVMPLIDQVRAFPSRHRDSRGADGKLSYVGGRARFDLIRHLPVVEVESGQIIELNDIQDPYSADWQREIG